MARQNVGVGSTVSIGEIEGATLVLESEGIASNDNDTTIPTSAAVKDYVDTNGGIANVVEDTTPQLGGNLDLNGNGIGDPGDLTKEITFNLSGATAGQTATIVSSHTGDRSITLPDATDTLVGKATTDTLTNKTFDANGTGNSLSNVEVADLAASAVVTEGEGIASNDNDTTLPTSAAVKDYADTADAAFTGSSNIVTVGTLSSGNATAVVDAASSSAAGKVELAIASEVTTGTDSTRAVTPDALAGSTAFGRRVVSIQVTAFDADVATGDGQAIFVIPEALNGMDLVRAQAVVYTAGTTNATTVMIRNKTDAVDMLSGAISIASAGTVGTVGTINTSTDDVATNDVIAVDVDSVSTTAPQGLMVVLEFALP